MKKLMAMAKKSGTPKGMQPQHGTERAVVKNQSNKGLYSPSARGAKAGAKGKKGY